MIFDAKTNLWISAIAIAPSPGNTGLSLTVTTGDGAFLPTPTPFNLEVWPAGLQPLRTNVTIVRVLTVVGDVLTLQGSPREQEGSSVRTIIVGDQISLNPTTKTYTDIEGAVRATEAFAFFS